MTTADLPVTELTLRERLTRCYTRPDDARMIADDIGLDRGRIDFEGPMAVVWWRVCDEAGKSPLGLHHLRARAHRDYPDDFPLSAPPPTADEALDRWLDNRWSTLREVRLLGYRRHDRVRLTLDEIFVSLRTHVVRRHPKQRPMRFDREHELAHGIDGPVDLPGALAYMESRGARGLALVGEPGAGKTTLLRHLFCRVRAEGSAAVGLPPGLVPVLLRCAELERGDRTRGGLADAIRRVVSREGAPEVAVTLAGGDRPLLVLLDGLDEVPDRETRHAVSVWLEDELAEWPRSRFVITCRFTAWRDGARLSGGAFVEAHIAWLSLERVRAYVHRWYFAVIVGADHGPPAEAEARADALAATLLDPEKQRRYRLRQMIQNPLMLATLCLVHYAGNRLPERRADLYDECIGFLLETWAEQGGRRGIPNGPAREVLKPLAWALHHRQAEVAEETPRPMAVHRDELTQIIAEPLRQVAELDLTADEFLARVRDDCGLFSGIDEERYEFLHLSFQEYLAARHAIDENRVVELADRIGEPFWREVILLALSDRAAYGPFMTCVVKRRQVAAHLDLLREAFTLAPKLDPEPFLPALRRPRTWWGRLGAWLAGGVDPGEVQAIFGLFRGRDAPAVRAAAEAWVDAEHPGVAAAAGALLRPAGDPAPTSERGPTGVEWVRIPAGTFWMGSSEDRRHPAYDPMGHSYERPPRRVTVSRDFWISRHPITNDDYRAFVDATGRAPPPLWTDPDFNQPRQPVVGVDWRDARAFAAWLGEAGGAPVGGGRVDLPTEAEWEYAARGSDGRRYPWGAAPPDAERAGFARSSGGPHPVGVHPAGASPFGVEDLAGGVWEWCLDAWREDFADWPEALDDPRRDGPPSAARVVRGGSWFYPSQDLRAASRFRYGPGVRSQFLGFRVVCRVSREHG